MLISSDDLHMRTADAQAEFDDMGDVTSLSPRSDWLSVLIDAAL